MGSCGSSHGPITLYTLMEDNNKYGKLLSEYLVECLLLNELAVRRTTRKQFEEMALQLSVHWDEIIHYHKHTVDKDKLLSHPYGEYIKFQSIVRSIACQVARKIPGNPMSDQSIEFINKYVCMRMNEDEPAKA